ncbi:hypothetical protein BRC81_14925 [Halobacteriales archaeon QS_1_68_20]|nr:MAG: hypothetical protein BRC81_14925 [Halobacteriales archaeon QS_1_68_20]
MLANFVRITYEADVIVVGEFVRRRTPPEPLEVEGDCIDELCQFLEPRQVDIWRRYQEVIGHSVRCWEVPTGGGDFIEVCGTGSDPEDEPDPKFGVSDARFVQRVDDTVVKPPEDQPIYSEPNPDLVAGEETTVVFEFDQIESPDQVDEPPEITLYRGHSDDSTSVGGFEHTDTFEIPLDRLNKIRDDDEHAIAVLHELANDGDSGNDLPVFEADSNPLAVITASNVLRFDFWERISEHPDDVVDLTPLKWGSSAWKTARTATGTPRVRTANCGTTCARSRVPPSTSSGASPATSSRSSTTTCPSTAGIRGRKGSTSTAMASAWSTRT